MPFRLGVLVACREPKVYQVRLLRLLVAYHDILQLQVSMHETNLVQSFDVLHLELS